MVAKSPDAFRTISEVAEDLDLPQHVLRFWETRFAQIKPLKRGGGRRYYRPDDIDLLRGIRFFLYGEGYTIRGVQRILKEQGSRFVISAGRGRLEGAPGQRSDLDDDATDGEIRDDHVVGPGRRHAPAFAAPPHPAERHEPSFDVEPEYHDPDEQPQHVPDYVPDLTGHEDEEDEEDIGSDARRLAMRFAPAQPEPATTRPAPPPRARPPSPERAHASAPNAQPASMHVAPAPPAGLAAEDAARLQTTLIELLELKRILDQAR
jgi:DNA-binding transcriptional MerR regulator